MNWMRKLFRRVASPAPNHANKEDPPPSDLRGWVACRACGNKQHERAWEKRMDAMARAAGSSGFENLSQRPQCIRCGSADLIRAHPEERIWEVIKGDDASALKSLIQSGVSVSNVGGCGRSLLHEARSLSVARILIEAGVNPCSRDANGGTPLHELACKDEPVSDIAAYLIECGAVVDAVDDDGFTPLHDAALHGNADLVRFLLENGANPCARCTPSTGMRANPGATPLHFAAANGHAKCAEILLGTGAPIDAQDDNGNTPLHRAAERGRYSVSCVLVAGKAKTRVQNKKGQTPLSIAREESQKIRMIHFPGDDHRLVAEMLVSQELKQN